MACWGLAGTLGVRKLRYVAMRVLYAAPQRGAAIGLSSYVFSFYGE